VGNKRAKNQPVIQSIVLSESLAMQENGVQSAEAV